MQQLLGNQIRLRGWYHAKCILTTRNIKCLDALIIGRVTAPKDPNRCARALVRRAAETPRADVAAQKLPLPVEKGVGGHEEYESVEGSDHDGSEWK